MYKITKLIDNHSSNFLYQYSPLLSIIIDYNPLKMGSIIIVFFKSLSSIIKDYNRL